MHTVNSRYNVQETEPRSPLEFVWEMIPSYKKSRVIGNFMLVLDNFL